MDGDYYYYTIDHCSSDSVIRYASANTLICLKAKAFLDLTARKNAGESIDSRKIRKHKTDIFRLATLFNEHDSFSLPDTLKKDLLDFIDYVKEDLPDKVVFKDLGIPTINVNELFQQFKSNFNLNHT